MEFALSTRWNVYRHEIGESLIDEIRAIGFETVELSYDLRQDLVPGIRKKVEAGDIRVTSVHNFCPVPIGFLRGHPELFSLSSLDNEERRSAVNYTTKTIRFAAELGAHAVVAHAGNVRMRPYSGKLIAMLEAGKRHTARYDKLLLKVQLKRDRKAPRHIEAWRRSIDDLLPVLTECRVRLGFENLPSWEAIPTEVEMNSMLDAVTSPHIGFWNDIGHGQIRQNLGLINQQFWLEKLAPRLIGMHIHDVTPPARDHVVPGAGEVAFATFAAVGRACPVRVFEFTAGTPPEAVQQGHAYVRAQWTQTGLTTQERDHT